MNNLRMGFRQHNLATIFVAISSVAMLMMLVCMRLYVPTPVTVESGESKTTMDQVCSQEQVQQVDTFMEENSTLMAMLEERFTSDAFYWQRPLHTLHAFGLQGIVDKETGNQKSQEYSWTEAANYAEQQLNVQSVMKGRTSIATINGSVYKEGESIELRGGDLLIRLVEVGSNFIVVQPVGSDDVATRRIIALDNSAQLVSGRR